MMDIKADFIVSNELQNVNIQEYFPQVLQYYHFVADENAPADNNIVFLKCNNLLETENNQETISGDLNNEDILQTEDIENIQIEEDSLINSPNLESVTLIDGSTAYLAVVPEDQYWHVKLSDGNYGLVQLKVQSLLSGNNGELADSNANDVDEQAPSKNCKKNRSHVCTYEGCGKTYTTLHHLKVHERTHTGSRPYKCEYLNCDKAFATTYSLKTHLRTHTGEKPYKCTTCGKPFKTSGDLQKHIRIHTGERPFVCPYEGCNQSFTTSNIRKVHLRTHTGERPYKCDVPECGKTFVSATNYKNHMRIHSGEKPYVCKEIGCSKRFTEYSSLYKHQIVHKIKKQKCCNLCNKLYSQNSTLVHHMKVIHGVTEKTNTEILNNVCSTHTENSTSEDTINGDSCILDNSSNIMFDSNVILDSATTESLDTPSNDEVLITDMQGNPVILRKFFKSKEDISI